GSVLVRGGLTLNASMQLGDTAGARDGAALYFDGSQTLRTDTGATIIYGGRTNNILGSYQAGQTLTIGPGVTLRGNNGDVGVGNANLVNQGTIAADVSLGTLNVKASTFTNAGTVSAANGGTAVRTAPPPADPAGHPRATHLHPP